ncbi:thioesterase domain-containing protein [Amycolatopsis sp. H20-H5]|uniref:thioesterase domain-containing protein n=1 Tax=Amycolatopsis sp. H20-H5 TaxID=3046309 RepID=UPI002DB8248B|nr:thioesterase domain-containing protein [Amycolatopsis sp. H20-H5]MEC3978257.1 thioesterase domain-containing protein [Amycolatopsis sp. H20-H5]
MAGHPPGEPAAAVLTERARIRRVALTAADQVDALERAWSFVLSGHLPSRLTRVCWAERDDTLHEQAARELANAPARFVRGTLLRTGSRAELLVRAEPAALDGPGLDRVVAEVLATCDGLAAGRLSVPEATAPAETAEPPKVPAPVAEVTPELVVLRDAGRPHLHLYYPGTGAGAAYRELVAALPSSWTITACDDAPHAESVEEMSEWYLAALRGRHAEPDLLGGWSMGGLVGLAAVRRRTGRAAGHRPGLVLIDSPPPSRHDAVPHPGGVGEFAEFLFESFALRGYRPVLLDVGADDGLGLALLSAGLGRAGEEVSADWLAEWLVQYRRQLRLLAGYQRRDPTDVRALLLLGELTAGQVEDWRCLVGERLSVERLGDGHFELLRAPAVHEVGRALTALAKAGHGY